MTFTVRISRRWLWPRRYRCKGVVWGDPAHNGLPVGRLMLILPDERRVFEDVTGRRVSYSREFFQLEADAASREAGQRIV